MAKATITHILNFGHTWTVRLDCGCKHKGLTNADIQRRRLYVGKRIVCGDHPTMPQLEQMQRERNVNPISAAKKNAR